MLPSLLLNFFYENIASVHMRPGMILLSCPPTAVLLRKTLGFLSWDSWTFSTSHFSGSQN